MTIHRSSGCPGFDAGCSPTTTTRWSHPDEGVLGRSRLVADGGLELAINRSRDDAEMQVTDQRHPLPTVIDAVTEEFRSHRVPQPAASRGRARPAVANQRHQLSSTWPMSPVESRIQKAAMSPSTPPSALGSGLSLLGAGAAVAGCFVSLLSWRRSAA